MKLLMLRKRVAAQAGGGGGGGDGGGGGGRTTVYGVIIYIAQWRGGGVYNIYNIHRLLRFDFHPCARFRQFSQKYTYNNSRGVYRKEERPCPPQPSPTFHLAPRSKIRKYV